MFLRRVLSGVIGIFLPNCVSELLESFQKKGMGDIEAALLEGLRSSLAGSIEKKNIEGIGLRL